MEDRIIEMENAEVIEAKKGSKNKGFIGKVGSGIKNNWKTVAVGAVALVIGYAAGLRNTGEDGISEEAIDADDANFNQAADVEDPE